MSTQKMSAQVVVEIDQKSLKQSEKELERLQSPEAIKMAIDLGSLRQQLLVLNKALKEALNVGDSDLAKKLGGDIEILKKQITGAGRELTNFVRTGDKDVSVLGKMFQQVGIDINSGFGKALTQASEGLAGFASKGLLLAGGGLIGAGLMSAGKQAIFLGDKLEQTKISFEVMLGSADKAKTVLSDLADFAKKTPFELTGLRDTAKQLVTAGVGVDKLIPTLRMLGDVASGTNKPIEQIAYAYGQVRTANQLYGTELMQFTNAGVPLLSELAKMFGVTEAQMKKMVEGGKIGFKDVEQAFKNMTGEGGRFHDLMALQSQTLSGQWSNLKDKIASIGETIGTSLLPAMKSLVAFLSGLVDFFQSAAGKAVLVTTAVGAFGFAILAVIPGILGLASAFTVAAGTGGVLAGVMALLGGPITLVIAGVAALSGGLYYLSQDTDKGSEATQKLTNRMNELKDKAEELKKKQEELRTEYENGTITTDEFKKKQEELQAQMKANGEQAAEYQSAMEILNNKSLSYAQKIDMINKLKLNPSAYNEVIAKNRELQLNLIKSIQLQAQLLKDKQKAADAEVASVQDQLPKVTNEGSLMTNYVSNDQLKGLGIAIDKRNTIVEEANKQLAKLDEERLKIEKEIADGDKKIKDTSAGVAEKYNATVAAGSKGSNDKAKKAEAERKKIYEDSIKFQKKIFENASKLRENDIKDTEAYISKLKKSIEEINDLEKEMTLGNADASKKTMEAVASQYRILLDDQKSLQEDLIKAQNETAGTASLPDPSIQKNLDETKKQIKELEDSGMMDQNTKAKEQQRASLDKNGQSRFDLQDKLGQIAIENANKQAELQRKKTEIEEKLGLSKYQAEQELIVQEKRKSANEIALNKYKDMIALIDRGITDNTQKEIDKRMALYAQEEQRLLRLIELRMQAGYAVGAITPAPVANTTNNNANVTVNANVANSVDMNALANTLARKIQLSSKGVS